MKTLLWYGAISIVLVLVVFIAGSAYCNEQVVGYAGFLPVRRLETRDSINRRTSRLAIDTTPETIWRGDRKTTEYWEVTFPRAEKVEGVWLDTGNQFRMHTLDANWLSISLVSDARPRLALETQRGNVQSIFDIWRLYALEATQAVNKVRLQYAGPEGGPNPQWALRDVRFLSPGYMHWDKETYINTLYRLPLPAGVAIVWWLLLAFLARRKGIK